MEAYFGSLRHLADATLDSYSYARTIQKQLRSWQYSLARITPEEFSRMPSFIELVQSLTN